MALVPLAPADAPLVARKKANNQFYARQTEASEPFFTNPDGFSGAPVFSLVRSGDKCLYTIIRVQSSWYPETGVRAACPFITFAQEIEAVVADALATHAQQVSAPDAA